MLILFAKKQNLLDLHEFKISRFHILPCSSQDVMEAKIVWAYTPCELDKPLKIADRMQLYKQGWRRAGERDF